MALFTCDPRPRRHSVARVKMGDVVMTDIYEHYCTHDRLWKSSVSRDVFKFLGIKLVINISVAGQYKDIDSCNGRLTGNRTWPTEWRH